MSSIQDWFLLNLVSRTGLKLASSCVRHNSDSVSLNFNSFSLNFADANKLFESCLNIKQDNFLIASVDLLAVGRNYCYYLKILEEFLKHLWSVSQKCLLLCCDNWKSIISVRFPIENVFFWLLTTILSMHVTAYRQLHNFSYKSGIPWKCIDTGIDGLSNNEFVSVYYFECKPI